MNTGEKLEPSTYLTLRGSASDIWPYLSVGYTAARGSRDRVMCGFIVSRNLILAKLKNDCCVRPKGRDRAHLSSAVQGQRAGSRAAALRVFRSPLGTYV